MEVSIVQPRKGQWSVAVLFRFTELASHFSDVKDGTNCLLYNIPERIDTNNHPLLFYKKKKNRA